MGRSFHPDRNIAGAGRAESVKINPKSRFLQYLLFWKIFHFFQNFVQKRALGIFVRLARFFVTCLPRTFKLRLSGWNFEKSI